MAKIYLRKIQANEMAIDDVPLRWRDEVQAMLDGAQQ
jgi:hypothetical protein